MFEFSIYVLFWLATLIVVLWFERLVRCSIPYLKEAVWTGMGGRPVVSDTIPRHLVSSFEYAIKLGIVILESTFVPKNIFISKTKFSSCSQLRSWRAGASEWEARSMLGLKRFSCKSSTGSRARRYLLVSSFLRRISLKSFCLLNATNCKCFTVFTSVLTWLSLVTKLFGITAVTTAPLTVCVFEEETDLRPVNCREEVKYEL